MQEDKRLLKTLYGLPNEGRPPFWFMRQAGRYLPEYREIRAESGGFMDMCFSPEKAAEVTLQPLRRFDMDAAIIFSDILVVPYALGIGVDFVKGEGPKLDAHDTPERIAMLAVTDVKEELELLYEAIEKVSSELPKDKTLIGFCGAPWTVATYVVEGGSSRDFAKTRKLAMKHPESFQHLIDVLVEASVIHLVAQVEAGAEAVQIFDSWAGVLPEGEYERWCIAPILAITEKFKALCPAVPVIGFPKGAGLRAPSFGLETGVNAIGLDMCVPLDAMKYISEAAVVQGNLDPILLALDKQGAVDRTKQILDAMAGTPFIFNLGHGIIPETPIENVEAVSQTIHAWKP
ncbi:MAG: uroporphyrinogen decarboxylase [Alphaproteobacteria bacterium]|nr:uroporphyrinogen decarboxylase [Alphaproteobacteria bacterium]